jgi:hypothetical protein
LTFGRRAFFVFEGVFAPVVFFFVLGLFALVVFLVFDLVRARFNEDLALARLTLFFMIFLPFGGRPDLNRHGVPNRVRAGKLPTSSNSRQQWARRWRVV